MYDVVSALGLRKPDAYNPYSAGPKMYGAGSPIATSGPVDRSGYMERDANVRNAQREALLRRLKAAQAGRYMSAEYLGGK